MSTDNHTSLLRQGSWLTGNSTIARKIGQPLRRFMEIQSAGGVVLLIATFIALVWINSPLQDTYIDLWATKVDIYVGNVEIFGDHSLTQFINDILMVLFFFVVGLEIKREATVGQLADARSLALPVIAALGGMVFPAVTYIFFNLGDGGEVSGWGIPMATDIAFALGVVSLLSDRVPRSLKIFLLTVAIADDIGAILVIAIFYSDSLSLTWLLAAVLFLVIIRLMRAVKIWWFPIYILLGAVAWWATYKSGVHATIAGVALGLITPAKPLLSFKEAQKTAHWLEGKQKIFVVDIRWAHFNIAESVSVAERLEKLLHPFVTFGIVPLFALANAGVVISNDSISNALTSPISWGIIAGLLFGKTVGIWLFTWIAVHLKITSLPSGMKMSQVFGVSIIAAIGFTVALFITSLEFTDPDIVSDAKIGILAASAVAATIGMYVLAKTCPRKFASTDDKPDTDSNSQAVEAGNRASQAIDSSS